MEKIGKAVSILLVFFTILSIFWLVPTCNAEDVRLPLELTMDITIKEINIDNHTVRADALVGIGGIPKNATYVLVKFLNVGNDVVNCTPYNGTWFISGGGTYDFRGEIKDKYWSFVGYGEAYPFDLYYLNFRLSDFFLIYDINGTQYGPDLRYSFDSSFKSVHFPMPYDEDILHRTWDLSFQSAFNPIQAGQNSLFIARRELNPQFLIIIPIFVLLFIIAISPFLCGDRETKIRLYSSFLVFSPMFIFAIQNFIPPRNTLSIAEFLGITLMFSAASMLLFSLSQPKSEKVKCYFEVGGLAFSLVFSSVMAFYLFQQILGYPPLTTIMILLILLFAGTTTLRAFRYRKHKQEQEKTNTERIPYSF